MIRIEGRRGCSRALFSAVVVLVLVRFLPAELPVVNSSIQVPAPTAMRAVECGRFATTNEANALIAELTNKGYAPIWQRTREDQSIQVLVGKCAYLPDAVWLRASLKTRGYPNAELHTYRDLEGLGSFSIPAMPDDGLIYSKQPITPATTIPPAPEPTFQLPGNAGHVNPPTAQDIATSTTLMNAAASEGRFSEAAGLGFAISRTLPDSDSAKGTLVVNSARYFVRGENKALPVIDNFVKVARGEIASTPEVQLEARWLAADAWHYYFAKTVKAREAYEEILTLHGTDAKVRARAMTEIVACMLELARSEAATYEEVHRACQELRATVPNSYERAHATADLIEGEAYFYDNKFEDAAAKFAALIQSHPTRIRETAMAHIFLADTVLKTGDWNTAKEHFTAVLACDFTDPKESFYWQGARWDLKKRAADNLLFKAKEQGDTETAATYEAYLQNESYLSGSPPIDAAFDKSFPHSFYEISAQ